MKRVLIVEDQADLRKLIRLALACEPYELLEAEHGAQALAVAQTHRPDLILLDVMMPGELDGLQVCKAVRAHPQLAATRVVLMTARNDARDHAAAREAGADDYLVKPVAPLRLLEALERWLPAD